MQRYFVLKVNNKIELQGNDFHHIKNVMKIENNGNIIISYDNKSYLASINYVNNSYEIIQKEEVTLDNELTKDVILYQALIKNDKFDLIVQKACELGVSEIYPVISSRSIIKIEKDKEDAKLIRYQKIIKEACEQSTRSILPKMNNYIKLKDIVTNKDTLYLLAYEKNNEYKSLKEVLSNIEGYSKIAIIIGPEGGFDKSEVEYLEKIGFKNVSLGKRILRAETAAIYGLSLIGHYIEG